MSLNKELINKIITVTSKAAISCNQFIGKNDKINADKFLSVCQQMKDKFNKSAEIKRRLTEEKITQMKEQAIKEIKNTSIDIAVTSVEKIIKNFKMPTLTDIKIFGIMETMER